MEGIHLTGPILSKIILWIVLEIIMFIWKREKCIIRWELCIGVWFDTYSDCDGNGHLIVEKTVEELDGILEYYEENAVFYVHIYCLLTE